MEAVEAFWRQKSYTFISVESHESSTHIISCLAFLRNNSLRAYSLLNHRNEKRLPTRNLNFWKLFPWLITYTTNGVTYWLTLTLMIYALWCLIKVNYAGGEFLGLWFHPKITSKHAAFINQSHARARVSFRRWRQHFSLDSKSWCSNVIEFWLSQL